MFDVFVFSKTKQNQNCQTTIAILIKGYLIFVTTHSMTLTVSIFNLPQMTDKKQRQKTWKEMKSYCFLSSFSEYDSYWIGLQVTTEFLWEDGTAKPDWLTLENDNKDCVYIEPKNNNQYEFRTKDCNHNRHYLCQMSFQSGESISITLIFQLRFYWFPNFICKPVEFY